MTRHGEQKIVQIARQLSHARPDEESSQRALEAVEVALSQHLRPHHRSMRNKVLVLGSVAACLTAVLIMLMTAATPQGAFAQVLQRIEKFDSVRMRTRTEFHDPKTAPTINVYYSTFAAGGRRRSELGAGNLVIIYNAQTSPDAELALDGKKKTAEFTLADADREALSSDNPVDGLKKFAMKGVKAAADEEYEGHRVSVYVSEKPEDLGNESRTRRVLVDKRTGLPVRIEIQGDMRKRGQGTYSFCDDSFKWNPPIDDKTFSTDPPQGYKITYDLIKPLSHAFAVYQSYFDGQLPDRVDSNALVTLKERIKAAPDNVNRSRKGDEYEADWGFSVPAFAAKHKLDLRYYGAGKSMRYNQPNRVVIAAIEVSPQSGKYEVLFNDGSRGWMNRSQLPQGE